MNADIISDLGSELVRIGASLRLHPSTPEVVFQQPEVSLPLIIAAINHHSTSDNHKPKVRGAFISKMKTTIESNHLISSVEIIHF